MEFKKSALALGACAFALSLASCSLVDAFVSGWNDGGREVKGIHENLTMIPNSQIGYEELPIKDMDSGLEIGRSRLTTYFWPDKANPFISFDEVISAFFSNKDISKRFDGDWIVYERTHRGKTFFVKFDTSSEYIQTNTYEFFFDGNYEGSIGKIYESDLHRVEPAKTVTFSLSKYNVNMFICDDEVILPAYVANTVFFAPSLFQLIYNNESFIVYNGYFDDTSDYLNTRPSELNHSLFPDGIYGARTEQLEFIFDYYYGLRKYKNINSGHSLIYSNDEILNNLKSNDPNNADKAYEALLLHRLQDLHTNLGFKSYYHNVTSSDDADMLPWDLSEVSNNYWNVYDTLEADYNNKKLSTDKVYFKENIAFIKFDSFDYEYINNILKEDGTFTSDAYKYSTFANLYLSFKLVDEYSRETEKINNIVLDVSMNGGGAVMAIPEALSFLTNRKINLAQRNLLTGEYQVESYNFDNDMNGDVNDADGLTKYNYYIMTSPVTFSAANTFAAIAKDMGLATIIGQKSSGGMCSVGNVSLIDGSTITFSSDEILSGYDYKKSGTTFEKQYFYDIESGVEPDIRIPTEKMYDFAYISQLITR